MALSAIRLVKSDFSQRFKTLFDGVAKEHRGALDSMAEMAVAALAAGQPSVASASAATVLLVEHSRMTRHSHLKAMIDVLTATGAPACGGTTLEGLIAWAGAALAMSYSQLPGWPQPDLHGLIANALQKSPDVALMLACALGEDSERCGRDADFAWLDGQVSQIERLPEVSPFWRGYWAIVSGWHLHSFGKPADACAQLERAEALAATHQLAELGTVSRLHRARLIEALRDPAEALALADRAISKGDPVHQPGWWAEHEDVKCRVALTAGDFHSAVRHARKAQGYGAAAQMWPGNLVPYTGQEGYALLGAGAIDEAIQCFRRIARTPSPAYQQSRANGLVDLTALCAADRNGSWGPAQRVLLADLMRRFRELEWVNVMPMFPDHLARIFAIALKEDIEVDWICGAIRTRRLPAPAGAEETWPWQVRVRAFGAFQVFADSGALKALHESGKAMSKPLELLRFLAARGHATALVEAAAETLWPGDQREGRQKAFDVTVARLRRLLDSYAAVIVKDRRVALNPQWVWIDTQGFDDRLGESQTAPNGSLGLAEALSAALVIYRAPCLEDSREPWAATARDGYRARLAAALLRASRDTAFSESQRREWLLRAISADPVLGELLASGPT